MKRKLSVIAKDDQGNRYEADGDECYIETKTIKTRLGIKEIKETIHCEKIKIDRH